VLHESKLARQIQQLRRREEDEHRRLTGWQTKIAQYTQSGDTRRVHFAQTRQVPKVQKELCSIAAAIQKLQGENT
jgi:hypothetical protein